MAQNAAWRRIRPKSADIIGPKSADSDHLLLGFDSALPSWHNSHLVMDEIDAQRLPWIFVLAEAELVQGGADLVEAGEEAGLQLIVVWAAKLRVLFGCVWGPPLGRPWRLCPSAQSKPTSQTRRKGWSTSKHFGFAPNPCAMPQRIISDELYILHYRSPDLHMSNAIPAKKPAEYRQPTQFGATISRSQGTGTSLAVRLSKATESAAKRGSSRAAKAMCVCAASRSPSLDLPPVIRNDRDIDRI